MVELLKKYFNTLHNDNKKMYEILDDLINIYGCFITNDFLEKDIRTIYIKRLQNNFTIKSKIILNDNYCKKNYIEIHLSSFKFSFITDY